MRLDSQENPHAGVWPARPCYPRRPGGVTDRGAVLIERKWTVGHAANRATAAAAARFLDKVLAEMPFPIEAIQVDGGSEFKAEFEDACRAKGLILYELPPKRPQLNGAVERCNGAWRYAFYGVYDLPTSVQALDPILDSFQHLYNHHRPHGALAGLTPAQSLINRRARESPASHRS